MSELRINNITDTAGSSGPIIAGVSTVTSTSHMVMPSGPTEMRGGRGRGIMQGGILHPYGVPGILGSIEIATTGDAVDFGTLTQGRMQTHALGNSVRGVFGGGLVPPNNTNIIEYVVISSSGGGNDFGDLTNARRTFTNGSSSNNTIGIFGAGYITANQNAMDFINIMTTGDASDFGDLVDPKERDSAACASTTRAIFAGGIGDDPAAIAAREIHFVNFASKGNSEIFAALTTRKLGTAGVSNSTRAVFSGGGGPGPSYTDSNVIDFITMSSGGEASDFGDQSVTRRSIIPMSSSIRGVFAGGYSSPHGITASVNTMDFITIATTGNATDFGDMLAASRTGGGASDSHGGLGD